MDPLTITLIGGAVFIGYLFLRQQQSDQSFGNFMSSIGGSDIPSNFGPAGAVPVNDTSAAPVANSGLKMISDWANAIFNFEGGKPGDLNVRNNNPGNLKFAGQPGATQDTRGFAVFQSFDDGFAALQRQLSKTLSDFPSLTLTQFYARYLGQSDYLNPKVTDQGDPFAYANAVGKQLGVSPDQTIGSIFGGHNG